MYIYEEIWNSKLYSRNIIFLNYYENEQYFDLEMLWKLRRNEYITYKYYEKILVDKTY